MIFKSYLLYLFCGNVAEEEFRRLLGSGKKDVGMFPEYKRLLLQGSENGTIFVPYFSKSTAYLCNKLVDVGVLDVPIPDGNQNVYNVTGLGIDLGSRMNTQEMLEMFGTQKPKNI